MVFLRIFVPALLAAGVTMLLTPVAARLAVRLRAVDEPGGRKRHRISKPRLGGLAIVAGIVLCLGPSLFFFARGELSTVSASEVLALSVATLIIFGIGVADDLQSLGPFKKLFFQLLAASIVVGAGWQFTAVRLPGDTLFSVSAIAPLLSVLWIVGVTNAINFIDGLDGLAAGIVAIIASSLLVFSILQRAPETVVATSCIVGACLGFLRHNWRPAKIYMGDSGSLTLGFLLAAISLRSYVKASTAVAILVPLLALGLPILDSLLVMWVRFLRGHERVNRLAAIFHADRSHLHYLLLDTTPRRSRVMMTLYGLAIAFCAMALIVAASGNVTVGLTFLGVEFAVIILIRLMGLRAEARRLASKRIDNFTHADGTPAAGAEGETPASQEREIERMEPATE